MLLHDVEASVADIVSATIFPGASVKLKLKKKEEEKRRKKKKNLRNWRYDTGSVEVRAGVGRAVTVGPAVTTRGRRDSLGGSGVSALFSAPRPSGHFSRLRRGPLGPVPCGSFDLASFASSHAPSVCLGGLADPHGGLALLTFLHLSGDPPLRLLSSLASLVLSLHHSFAGNTSIRLRFIPPALVRSRFFLRISPGRSARRRRRFHGNLAPPMESTRAPALPGNRTSRTLARV